MASPLINPTSQVDRIPEDDEDSDGSEAVLQDVTHKRQKTNHVPAPAFVSSNISATTADETTSTNELAFATVPYVVVSHDDYLISPLDLNGMFLTIPFDWNQFYGREIRHKNLYNLVICAGLNGDFKVLELHKKKRSPWLRFFRCTGCNEFCLVFKAHRPKYGGSMSAYKITHLTR